MLESGCKRPERKKTEFEACNRDAAWPYSDAEAVGIESLDIEHYRYRSETSPDSQRDGWKTENGDTHLSPCDRTGPGRDVARRSMCSGIGSPVVTGRGDDCVLQRAAAHRPPRRRSVRHGRRHTGNAQRPDGMPGSESNGRRHHKQSQADGPAVGRSGGQVDLRHHAVEQLRRGAPVGARADLDPFLAHRRRRREARAPESGDRGRRVQPVLGGTLSLARLGCTVRRGNYGSCGRQERLRGWKWPQLQEGAMGSFFALVIGSLHAEGNLT